MRTDAGVIVVGLDEEGIVIGDVLQTTNNLPLADGQLKVISRFSGQTPITINGSAVRNCLAKADSSAAVTAW